MRGMTLVELLITLSLIMLLSVYGLQGWQQQRQRLVVDGASLSLLSFLSQVQTIASRRNQTLIIKQQRTATGQWCLWVSARPETHPCKTASLHWCLHDAHVQLQANHPSLPVHFRGAQQSASGSRWQLQSGPYQLQVVLSSKGRLSRCSGGSHFTHLRRCQ